MRRIGRNGRDAAGEDQALAARGARAALVGMTAVHDQCGPVEPGLQEFLVGLIVDRGRHLAFRVGDHAVAGDDDVTLDAARPEHADHDSEARPPSQNSTSYCR